MGRLEAHPTINILILWGGHPACPSQQGYLIYFSHKSGIWKQSPRTN